MIRNGVIATAAVLALGTIAIATDASAQGMREHGSRAAIGAGGNLNAGGGFGSPRTSASASVRTGAHLGTRTMTSGHVRSDIGARSGTWGGSGMGYASTRGGSWNGNRTAFTRTSWNRSSNWERGDWRRHHRFSRGWGWGPSVGIGFAAASYGYGYDWGPDYVGYDYDWAPSYDYGYAYDWSPSYVSYGASYGYPTYAYGYDYDYPAYAYAAPVGFGVGIGFGFSGGFHHRHHHHW